MLHFKINNRRYTGSKFKLLDWIKNTIEDALFLIRAAGLENVIIKPFDIGEFLQKLETDSVLN